MKVRVRSEVCGLLFDFKVEGVVNLGQRGHDLYHGFVFILCIEVHVVFFRKWN